MKRDQMPYKENWSEDRLLSRDEVMKRFGIPKRFLELAVNRGNGPRFLKVGRLVRYRVVDIRTWIDEQMRGGDQR